MGRLVESARSHDAPWNPRSQTCDFREAEHAGQLITRGVKLLLQQAVGQRDGRVMALRKTGG